ncbi:hypothetical protein C8R45DRAFT_929225 [Mycena sanguinolenta]|nr:hypothetical protein C8R45DRAFT_929225 [Mycena sanguinolenta]
MWPRAAIVCRLCSAPTSSATTTAFLTVGNAYPQAATVITAVDASSYYLKPVLPDGVPGTITAAKSRPLRLETGHQLFGHLGLRTYTQICWPQIDNALEGCR